MGPLASTIITSVFLLFGLAAVFTMLVRLGRKDVPKPERLRRAHRLAGWGFAALYLVMFFFMLGRVEDYWEESSPRIALHVAFAVALFFLLALKVTIPRFFPMMGRHLFWLGVLAYLAAFSLGAISAGYYIIRAVQDKPYISHAELPRHLLDEELGKQLFITECSTCHLLENIMKPRTEESWEEVMNQMVAVAAPRISPAEARQILHYLVVTHRPKPYAGPPANPLIEKHCLPCHRPQEIYGRALSRELWRQTVLRMHRLAPEIVPEEKVEEITGYLSEGR